MYRQFNIQQFYVLSTQRIYVFCVDHRTNSHYFPIQHYLTGFYNQHGMFTARYELTLYLRVPQFNLSRPVYQGFPWSPSALERTLSWYPQSPLHYTLNTRPSAAIPSNTLPKRSPPNAIEIWSKCHPPNTNLSPIAPLPCRILPTVHFPAP